LLKGSYVILLENREEFKTRVGFLGALKFERGFYAYIGSMFGPGGLEARIRRYLVGGKKHWHIDYILGRMQIISAYILSERNFESVLAKASVKRFRYVKGFGCSDKRDDISHLLYFRCKSELEEFIKLIRSMGFEDFKIWF
jgi:Uri superfamily endonuclease